MSFICDLIHLDIVQGAYREKPKVTEQCTAMNRYIFNCESLAASQYKDLPVDKSILRAYLEVTSTALTQGHATKVDVEIYMNLLGRNSSSRVEAGRHQLSVTAQSNAWIELNITEGVQSLWPPNEDESRVEITVMLRTDCVFAKKVPVIFKDPTSIEPSQRQGHSPLFVIYLRDNATRDIVTKERKNKFSKEEHDESPTQKRNKRSADSICQIEDFHINFADLQLDYVTIPIEYNAKQCSGSCSHSALSLPINSNLGTNHAKIMASAKAVSEIPSSGVSFDPEPRVPCCVPDKYEPLYVIFIRDGGCFEKVLYPHMIIMSCKCK